jgi:phage shock protein A
MRAQQDIRKMDSADAILKFDELENRIERMEAEADLVNLGGRSTLKDEMENLSADDEIEKELQALKESRISGEDVQARD